MSVSAATAAPSVGEVELLLHVQSVDKRCFEQRGSVSLPLTTLIPAVLVQVQKQLGMVGDIVLVSKGRVLADSKMSLEAYRCKEGEKRIVLVYTTKPEAKIVGSTPPHEVMRRVMLSTAVALSSPANLRREGSEE